jgi:hypothetical protein
VAMLDRRKLAGPLCALAVSFAVVLVIGAFAGHPPAARGVRLTISLVAAPPASTGSFGDRLVSVLGVSSLERVASGRLNAAGMLSLGVAAGSYLVCANPPGGWMIARPGEHVLAGWICAAKAVGASPAHVTLYLARQGPRRAGKQ